MKHRKYQTAAKTIFLFTFWSALIAAGVYCVLAYFDFKKEIPFEWEYLAALGGVVAIGAILAIWLLCIGRGVKKKEEQREKDFEAEERTMDACAEYAAEPDYIYIQQPTYVPDCCRANLSFSLGEKKKTEGAVLDVKKLNKAAKIAIPAVAVTAVAAVVLATKARKKRKIEKLLYALERDLGYRK